MISVVIPTFNEMSYGFLPQVLKNLSQFDGIEVICVDAHSTDGTVDEIKKYPFKLIQVSTNSRAVRINKGVSESSHDLVLLHHPRSLLEREGIEFLKRHRHQLDWGGFTHRFDTKSWLLRFTSWYSNNVRGRISEIIYLDHCLFFKKSLLGEAEPIPEVDIFEDTLLSMKLKEKAPARILPFRSETSAVRFVKNGVFRQSMKNQALKIAFMMGLSHETMNRFYEKGLELNSKYS